MQRLLKQVCYATLLSAVSFSAHALINIQLTKWANNAIPIAIAPLGGQSNNESSTNIASVITNDLKNSGRFNPLSSGKMPADPNSPNAINYREWLGTGADYLVVGQVKPVGGQYQVNVALTNIFGSGKGKQGQGSDQHVILSEQYTVPAQDLRALAHHISDKIYEKLIGQRGIFSTKIAYVSVDHASKPAQYQLIVADADGYNPRSLLTSNQPIMSPSWSPNGRDLAYVSFEKDHPQIFVQNVASGSRTAITNYKGINGAPSWSPDGNRLAIVLSKTGVPKIYTVNADGSGLTQITDGVAIDTEPDWSPNGRQLVFTSNRGGSPQLYQVDLGSRSVQRLTYNGTYNARGQYTPDGKNIVMLHRDEAGDFVIAAQDVQSGVLRLLTRSPLDESPSIAPNGSMVLYSTSKGDRLMLGMVSTDGSVKCQLPAKNGDVQSPSWSPFLS